MRTVNNVRRRPSLRMLALAAAAASAVAAPATAAVIININPLDTGGVIAQGGGTLNLSALTIASAITPPASVNPNGQFGGQLFIGNGSRRGGFGGVTGFVRFGTGGQTNATLAEGNPFGIVGVNTVYAPVGYVNGATLTGKNFWANATIDSLGLNRGTHTATWGSGANADSFTIVISDTVVSLSPTTYTWNGPAGGTWDASSANWTSSQGTVWQNGVIPAHIARFASPATVNVASGINASRLEFLGSTQLNGGSINLTALSGMPTIDVAADSSIGSTLQGSAGLAKTGAAMLTLSGNNTYTGGTTINAGTLSVASDGNLGGASGGLTFNGGALRIDGTAFASTTRTITWGVGGGAFDIVDPAHTFTLNQSLANGGGLTKLGAGTLTLGGNADNIGLAPTVNAGTLVLAKQSDAGVHAVGGLGLTVNGGTAKLAGTGGDQIWDGTGVTLNAGGTLDLNGTSETINALVGAAGSSLTNTNNSAVGNLTVTGGGTFAGTIGTFGNGINVTVAGQTFTMSGTTDNAYLAATVNAGTLVLAKDSNAGVHAIGGGLTINGGTARLGGTGGDQIFDNNTVTVNTGGTFDLDGRNETIATLNGAGTVTSASAATLRVSSGSFGGAINGAVGLNKVGVGTLVLSGANGYTGGTTISGGTLQVSSFGNLGPGSMSNPLTLDGGRLSIVGLSVANRPITVTSAGGEVSVPDGNSTLTLGSVTLNGTLTKSGPGGVSLTATGAGGINLQAGTVQFSGGTNPLGSGMLTLYPGTELRPGIGGIELPNAIELPLADSRVIFQVFNNSQTTLSGVVGGTGALALTGASSNSFLRYAGNSPNTLSGLTTLTKGLLVLAKDSQAGVGNFGAAVPGDLTINGGTNVRLDASHQIGDASTTTVNGTLDLNGNVEGLGTLNGTGTVASTPAATLSASSGNFGGAINGGISLNKSGPGTLVLSGRNGYTGTTTVQGGTLALANNATSTGGVTVQTPTITVESGATLRFDTNDNFGGHNTATGPNITVNAGTVTNSGGYINAIQNLTLNGGTLSAVGEFNAYGAFSVRDSLTSTGTSTINLGANRLTLGQDGDTTFNVTGGTLTVASPIADNVDGAGALNKTGVGTLVLTAANTFTGGVSISDFGTLAINADSALGASTNAIRFDNGVLRTDAAMTIARNFNIDTGKVGIVNTNRHDVTVSGKVDGAAGLIKQGDGTLTLTNTTNGQWNNRIDAGTLAISDDRHLGLAGGILFMNGGTLRADASVTLARPISMQAGQSTVSTISAGNNTVTLTGEISGNSPLTLLARDGRFSIAGPITSTGGLTFQATPVTSGSVPFATFSIEDGASLPSGSVQLAVPGASSLNLFFNNSDALTVPSNIGVSGSGTTTIAVRGGGAVTLNGSDASRSLQFVVANGSSAQINGNVATVFLDVGGRDPQTGQLGAGTLGGTGLLRVSNLDVGHEEFAPVRGTIRGDWGTGTGTLTITGSGSSFNLYGAPDASAGRIAVQLAIDTQGAISDQSNLLLSGFGTVFGRFGGPVGVELLGDDDLVVGQTYKVDLVTVESGVFSGSYQPQDFMLFSGSGLYSFDNVTPSIANQTLSVSFTVNAIPEPASLPLLAAAAGILSRRRRRHCASHSA